MSLLFRANLQLATESLKRNRGRTILSGLGIAIGVSAIVLSLSLAGSAQKLVTSNDTAADSNLILVRPQTQKDLSDQVVADFSSASSYQTSTITLDMYSKLTGLDTISSIAPLAVSEIAVKTNDKTIPSVTLVASTKKLAKTTSLPLRSGNFFDGGNQQNGVVVGYNAALRIFGTADAVSKTFTYKDQLFMVLGVLEKLDNPINYNGVDFDSAVIADISFLSTIDPSLQIQQINIRASSSETVKNLSETIQDTLKDDGAIHLLSSETGFTSNSPLASLTTILLNLIAIVSLVVGGIGVMNVMLVSVSERTREIGIRKSIGASSSNILMQFLLESLILCLSGGFSGIILGYVFAFFISLTLPFTPYLSLEIILITSITTLLTGLLSGLYPALKAAHKDPVTSLKYYR